MGKGPRRDAPPAPRCEAQRERSPLPQHHCQLKLPLASYQATSWGSLKAEEQEITEAIATTASAPVEAAVEAEGDLGEPSAVSVQPLTLTIVAVPGSEVDYGTLDSEEEAVEAGGEPEGGPEARFEPGTAPGQLSGSGHAKEEGGDSEARFEPGVASAGGTAPPGSSTEELKTEPCVDPISPAAHFFKPAARGGPVRLGTAKARLLQELARADTANWQGLVRALEEAKEPGTVKSSLVDDLSRLSDQRRTAAAAVKAMLRDEVERIQGLEEEDEEYRRALEQRGDEMLRLEKNNPVRPSKTDAGVGVWVARRREKARQRAQAHHALLAQGAAQDRAGQAPPEMPASPREAAEERARAAREEIAAFRARLQGWPATSSFRRAPDSKRRKALKRDRQHRRARLGPSTHDATRDTNHAIAHVGGGGWGWDELALFALALWGALSLLYLGGVVRAAWRSLRQVRPQSGPPEPKGLAEDPRASGQGKDRVVPDLRFVEDVWHLPTCPLRPFPAGSLPGCRDCRPAFEEGLPLLLTRVGKRVRETCPHLRGRRRHRLAPCSHCLRTASLRRRTRPLGTLSYLPPGRGLASGPRPSTMPSGTPTMRLRTPAGPSTSHLSAPPRLVSSPGMAMGTVLVGHPLFCWPFWHLRLPWAPLWS